MNTLLKFNHTPTGRCPICGSDLPHHHWPEDSSNSGDAKVPS